VSVDAFWLWNIAIASVTRGNFCHRICPHSSTPIDLIRPPTPIKEACSDFLLAECE